MQDCEDNIIQPPLEFLKELKRLMLILYQHQEL